MSPEVLLSCEFLRSLALYVSFLSAENLSEARPSSIVALFPEL